MPKKKDIGSTLYALRRNLYYSLRELGSLEWATDDADRRFNSRALISTISELRGQIAALEWVHGDAEIGIGSWESEND